MSLIVCYVLSLFNSDAQFVDLWHLRSLINELLETVRILETHIVILEKIWDYYFICMILSLGNKETKNQFESGTWNSVYIK